MFFILIKSGMQSDQIVLSIIIVAFFFYAFKALSLTHKNYNDKINWHKTILSLKITTLAF